MAKDMWTFGTTFLVIIVLVANGHGYGKSCRDTSWLNTIGGEIVTSLLNFTRQEVEILINEVQHLRVSKSDVVFYLYTTDNPYLPFSTGEAFCFLNPSYPTKIMTHGWDRDVTYQWIPDSASAYHRKGNMNIILIDWSKQADQNFILAATATKNVGNIVGDFIVRLYKNNLIFLNNIHLIGHSLGAHVVGFAGKRVKRRTGKEVARVTGLDAAGPWFTIPTFKDPQCRIADTDGTFVDLIHVTNGIGVIPSLANADFFVNGGLRQLNCSNELPNIMDEQFCQHGSAPIYFLKSIKNPKAYPASSCDSFISSVTGRCDNNNIAYMGDGVNKSASGSYYISIDENGNAENGYRISRNNLFLIVFFAFSYFLKLLF